MTVLSPSKLIGGEWFRLARSSDGILCLESISDTPLNHEWAFCAEVPRYIAWQLTDDSVPDLVAKVLDRAIRVLGYAQ